MIGNRAKGFTLIELIVVLLIISVLAAIVSPMVSNSVTRSREAALRENLFVMRKLLDDYYSDNGKYPSSLEILVEEGYIHEIPIEPFTKEKSGWRISYDEDGGVSNIYSGYDGVAHDGSYYHDW